MKKLMMAVIPYLVATSIIAAASAMVKVSVQEERVNNLKETVKEISEDVKWIRGTLTKKCYL